MDYKKIPGKTLKKYGEYQNNDPVISIITPFYNTGKEIEETYNSVMNQTYPYFEWIIVDDGSANEDSIKLLSDLSKRDDRIKTYTIKNGGPSIARDYGIEKTSKTKYVFFLDSDDMIDKTTLECFYWTLETHPEASFAYSSIINFGNREFIWEKYFSLEQEKEENLLTIASMVKKEDLLEVGCFGIKEKAMYEDWNLWLKLLKAGKKPIRVSAPLFWYRQTENGEFQRANHNREAAMKYVNETAASIPDNLLEAIQFPRVEKTTQVEIDHMILPSYKKEKDTLLFFLTEKNSREEIKELSNKYHVITFSTSPLNYTLRQGYEEYSDVYDLSAFLDRVDYLRFTDYIISSRKVDKVMVNDNLYGTYMLPYLSKKYKELNLKEFEENIYDLSIETDKDNYRKIVENYYKEKFDIDISKKEKNPRRSRHLKYFLQRINAEKDFYFLRKFYQNFINLLKSMIDFLYSFLLAIPAFFVFLWKCFKRIITKPFR